MTAYAVAHLHEVTMGPAIVEYLERIDDTLKPFGGQFLVHGDDVELREGSWPGSLIVIAFPDLGRARAWYTILPLRTENSVGDVVMVQGVSPEHHATDVLAG
ncbi:DUF1330 domain-containing protein [Streptantibioticus ferralitis]|uniref:DUF1330 domain-containing protein n=1 Tax=Streptantibioticus ferralitis TaxID=236510 RepID=A0ABT5Z8J3_9ACTN|nr:DUF1330 domain-containing protein [Streptantibioticus ferralitis]MDF2260136.1 DUF1330 domain-containing protein [Streptantibioticus ferralitis]